MHLEILYAKGVSEAARALGVAPSTIRNWRSRGAVPERYLEAIEAMGRGEEITPPVVLDPIPAGHHVKGVSTLVAADGSVSQQWIKTRAEEESREAAIARLLRELPASVPALPRGPTPEGPSRPDLVAVYPMGDPHVGMLAWKHETGASFDLEIAERLMLTAIRDLVQRGPRAETALLINLGDFFHFDNSAQKTTRGDHTLDVDGRVSKVLTVGFRIMYETVRYLLEHHESVIVDTRKGNHDEHTAICLAIGLAAYFRAEPRVTVTIPHTVRGYYRFGKCLIGTAHGDRGKMTDLGAIMAEERAPEWGATTERVWFCGHVHHSTVTELRGVRIETFRTLAARDSWHAGQGYISGRDMARIVFHREYGQISREIACVQYLEAIGAA